MGWQWHQLGHMQIICTTLQTDNHASTPSLNFLRARCSSWCPTNSVKALKAVTLLILLQLPFCSYAHHNVCCTGFQSTPVNSYLAILYPSHLVPMTNSYPVPTHIQVNSNPKLTRTNVMSYQDPNPNPWVPVGHGMNWLGHKMARYELT